MSSKLHHLKAAVVATIALTAAGAGVAGASGALNGADDRERPTNDLSLPATAAERAAAAVSDDHGKANDDRWPSDPATAHENHGSEVSTFAHTTELEGREKGQAVAGVASDGRSDDDHGQSDESHGRSDESHGRSDESHGRSDDDHGKDAEHRSDD